MTLRQQLDEVIDRMIAAGMSYEDSITELKRQFIITVLISHGGNGCKAAKALGMHRNTLSRTCEEQKINVAHIRRLCNIRLGGARQARVLEMVRSQEIQLHG